MAVVLTRLPRSEKLTPVETMKLAAGEVAGEKSIKTLAEVIDTLNQDPDITNRFGQKGLGQRNLGRAIQLLVESSETNEGRCMFAYDIFKALERVILDYVHRRQRPRQVPRGPEDRQGPLPRADHDRDVQRLHGRAAGHPQGRDELRQHDHRHRRREPRARTRCGSTRTRRPAS